MRIRKPDHRFCTLLLTAVLLAAVVSGCAQTGENAPKSTLSDDWTQKVAESAQYASESPVPADRSEPEQTPSAAPKPAAETDPAEESAPVTVPEPDSTPQPAETLVAEPTPDAASVPQEPVADTTPVEAQLEDEAVALSAAPAAIPHRVSVEASGVLEKKNVNAVIDYSNTADGYVMVQYTAQSDLRLKVQVKGPSTTYTYNLTPRKWAAFPLSDGNGVYQVTIYQNVTSSRYAAVLSLNTPVELKDEFAPFLHSNQYVDYDNAPKTTAAAAQLIGTQTDPLKKVEAVYDYVVKGMTYDKELAAGVKSGYLPVLDTVLEKKSGICFDYAALMTGMLRSQGVPCKLVVGYAGTAYHAWISVWVEESGWVDGVIWFNGTSWQRMDPTFASSGGGDPSILAYIGDGTNYTAKYFY